MAFSWRRLQVQKTEMPMVNFIRAGVRNLAINPKRVYWALQWKYRRSKSRGKRMHNYLELQKCPRRTRKYVCKRACNLTLKAAWRESTCRNCTREWVRWSKTQQVEEEKIVQGVSARDSSTHLQPRNVILALNRLLDLYWCWC